MARSWTIGASGDCDLVVNQPMVSGRHCRLSADDQGFVVEDLRSTNGTYVNGVRIAGSVRVSRTDSITLGQTVPMPWPGDGAPATSAPPSPSGDVARLPKLVFRGSPIVLGRNADCDRVLDVPMVSGRHARLVLSEGQLTIEDLGSSNGTFVNDQQIHRLTVVRPGDTISLGSYSLVLVEEGRTMAEAVIPAPSHAAPTLKQPIISPPPSPRPLPPAPPAPPGLESPAGPWWSLVPEDVGRALRQPGRLAALLAQAPLAAALIVLALKVDREALSTPAGWASQSHALAAIVFWLGLAAIWFGLSNAILGSPIDEGEAKGAFKPGGSGIARIIARLAVFSALCVLQCVVVWAIVGSGAGMKGTGLAGLALLVLASVVGLALGLVVVSLAPRRTFAWAFLPVAIVPLWLFGGESQPLPRMASWTRSLAGALPSRWAFEGLLLLEAERHEPPSVAGSLASDRVRDLAEDYFPAESERMGVQAAALALAAMLVGLSASAAFISEES